MLRRVSLRALSLLVAACLLLPTPCVSATETQPWLILVYMVGSNLESGTRGGLASADIREMMQATTNSPDCLLMTGGASAWMDEALAGSTDCMLWRVSNGVLYQQQNLGSKSMGDPDTLALFLRYAQSTYPDSRKALVLWDHGAGPLGGFGRDELFENDTLTLPELSQALSSIAPLEIIGIDACLMGSSEVAAALRDSAEYLVASEEAETGDGWNYTVLSAFTPALSTTQAAHLLVDSYQETYTAQYADYPDYAPVLTLSAIRLNEMDGVIKAANTLFGAMLNSLSLGGYSTLTRSQSRAQSVGTLSTGFVYDLVDMHSLCNELAALYPTEADALSGALSAAVEYHWSNRETLNGLSVFLPDQNKDLYRRYRDRYMPLCDTYATYLEGCATYWNKPSDAYTDELVLQKRGDAYTYTLTPAQQADFERAAAVLLVELDGIYHWVGSQISLTPNAESQLIYPFDDLALWLQNEDDEVPLPLFSVVEQPDGSRRGYANAILMGEIDWLSNDFTVPMENVQLEMALNTDDRALVLSVKPIGDEDEFGSGKETLAMEDFVELSVVAVGFAPVYATDGELLPFSQWETADSFLIETLDISMPTQLVWQPYPADWKMYVQFVIHDTYGNTHRSELLPVER